MLRSSITVLAIIVTTQLMPAGSFASTFPLDQKDKVISPTQYPYGLERYKVIYRIGFGGNMLPSYLGSSEYEYSPITLGSVEYVKLPYLTNLERLPYFSELLELPYIPDSIKRNSGNRKKPKDGFYLRPSFAANPSRIANDFQTLTGLNNVPFSFETGIEAGFRLGNFRGYSRLRRGIRGHHGYRGNIGGQFSFAPTYRTNVNMDARVSFASSKYINSYFGITEEEAISSPIFDHSYTGDSGLTDAHITMDSYHDITDKRRFHLSVGYTHLLSDVSSSPIVKNGSANQFNVRIGTSYRFVFDLTDDN